jgi:hypothetical protein
MKERTQITFIRRWYDPMFIVYKILKTPLHYNLLDLINIFGKAANQHTKPGAFFTYQ